MITPVNKTADLLTTPHHGGEPEHAAAERPTAARTQPGSDKTPSKPIDRATLDQAVAKVSDLFKATDSKLRLEVDDDTKRVVVKVFSEESGEVIRQIPAKEILEMEKYFSGSKGVLLKQQA